MRSTCLLIISLCLTCTFSEKENVLHSEHGHLPEHHQHYSEDGVHDPAYDHEAVLGSHDAEDEYAELSPEESKRRLRILATQMDTDNDEVVTLVELTAWVMASFKKLDDEEAMSQMREHDLDQDGAVTWAEYLQKIYGFTLEDLEEMDREEEGIEEMFTIMADEKLKFRTADVNGDEKLDEEEYLAFENPYAHEHMHAVEVDRVLKSFDKSKDGLINFKEFLGDRKDLSRQDEIAEKEQFRSVDKNKDARIDRDEIAAWVLPENQEAAADEAEHLIEEADGNSDGQLTIDEIVERFDVFVGSQTTNYGEDLHKMTDEL